jgi:hypothetical protein
VSLVIEIKNNLGPLGRLAMTMACLFGLACAAVGGMAGLVAAIWHGVTLLIAWHRAAPKAGMTTFGLAAIYGLAAESGFGGTDPEDVDPHLSTRLAVVAVGCAVVGVISVVVWIADSLRRRQQLRDLDKRASALQLASALQIEDRLLRERALDGKSIHRAM